MPELRWSPRAEEALLDIALEIGRWSEGAAFRFVDRVRDLGALLADRPRIGPRRDDILRGARMLVEGAYLILYRTIPIPSKAWSTPSRS